MPLPNGSPYPGLIEVLLIALVGCCAFWVLPVMSAVWLLSAYGLIFTFLVIPPYLMHGKDMPGRHAFALLTLVGLLFLFQEIPWVVGITAMAILVVGLYAMHASLLYMPRYGETSNDAMETEINFTPVALTGVEPEKIDQPLPPIQALGLSMLLAYWAGILHHLVEPGHVAIAGPSICIGFIAFFRYCFYVEKRRAPITLKQRLKMRILTLSSYDKVYVAPLLSILVCVAVLSAGYWLLINPPLVTAGSIFLAMLILSMIGPARQHWQMTSDHRVVVC